jgi:ArsR family transcriptional regulator, cadmium/lead-responsive transcriptional repressor
MSAGGRERDALRAAVGDPTRRRLLDALLTLEEATATTLSGEVPVTRQAVAKHLMVLQRAGLVGARRNGRELLYAVRPERLDEVSQAMARISAAWDQRLTAIKRLAESAHIQTRADEQSTRQAQPPAQPEKGNQQ